MSAWDKPQEVADKDLNNRQLRIAGKLLPVWKEIPREFRLPYLERGPHKNLYSAYYYIYFTRKEEGKALHMRVKPGIDITTAGRHLDLVMGNISIFDEHQLSGWCFLADKWFEIMEVAPITSDPPEGVVVWDKGGALRNL